MKDNRKFWHRLPKKEVDKLYNDGATIGYVQKNYRQPRWCGYPDALHPAMGCWSLSEHETRTKISHKYCKGCDCYINKKKQT